MGLWGITGIRGIAGMSEIHGFDGICGSGWFNLGGEGGDGGRGGRLAATGRGALLFRPLDFLCEFERIGCVHRTNHMKQILSLALLTATTAFAADQEHFGYKDTPLIPGTKWHIHDGERPQPKVITPGEKFSQMASAPSDAVVLF